MGVLALSAQSVVEALTGAALQPRLRRLLVSMETTQPGLEPWQTQHRIVSYQTQDMIIDMMRLIWSFSHFSAAEPGTTLQSWWDTSQWGSFKISLIQKQAALTRTRFTVTPAWYNYSYWYTKIDYILWDTGVFKTYWVPIILIYI